MIYIYLLYKTFLQVISLTYLTIAKAWATSCQKKKPHQKTKTTTKKPVIAQSEVQGSFEHCSC